MRARLAVALTLLLLACSSAPPTPTPAPATPTEAPSTASPAPTEAPTATASESAAPSATVKPTAPPPTATGKGVTVAIIDRGIDWRNPDFLNPDGTTRIKAALDMSAQSNWCFDSAQFPKPQAVEITEDQINAALKGTSTLDFRDAVGHGTATAGLAAGNGSALADKKYAGIAPEADLLIVKQTSEGAPAHGDQPEEKQFNACFDDAVDWVAQKMDALNQPGVVIWNSGTQWGPIDGSSAISRKINQVFPADKPGRIWVSTSGDEGGLPNHAGADYTATTPATISFKVTANITYPTAWYSGDAPASVTIELSDGTKVGPVAAESNANEGGVQLLQYPPGKEFYPWISDSGDRAVWMRIEGHAGQTGTITFQAADEARPG